MSDLTERRLAIAEARFDDYEFGWEVEEVHHWLLDAAGEAFSRTVLFCGDAPGSACLRGEFVVRFLKGRPFVDECYALVDGCLIGRDPGAAQVLRKAG